jgi:hypothetical protein
MPHGEHNRTLGTTQLQDQEFHITAATNEEVDDLVGTKTQPHSMGMLMA